MRIHYFCHTHTAALPHTKCLLSSIRAFDQKSPFTVVFDDSVSREEIESFAKFSLIRWHWMSDVERECGTTLPWRKAAAGKSPRDEAWMMQACLPWWMLQKSTADWLVYTDCDMWHYHSIEPYLDALPETAHVGICAHHYPPGRENVSAGIYNNGLLAFRNSDISREHFLRWGCETIERWQPGHPREIPHEQKLLDEWPEQLKNACIELPRGMDCGPWQLPEITISSDDCDFSDRIKRTGPRIYLTEPCVPAVLPLIQSFHFHEHRLGVGKNPVTIKGQQFNRTNYPLDPSTIESVYKVYETALAEFL